VRTFCIDYAPYLISVSQLRPKGGDHTDDGSHLIASKLVLIMRITARAFLHPTLLLSLVAGLVVSGAGASSASTLTVYYAGTVTSVSSQMITDTGVVVGDTLSGMNCFFSYNTNQLGSLGVYTYSGSNPASNPHNFSVAIFNSSGAQQFADTYTGDYATGSPDYFVIKMTAPVTSPSTPAEFSLMGDTTYKAGAGFNHSHGTTDYNLVLQDPSYTATTAPPLPTSSTITKFTANQGTLTWDPAGDAFTANIFEFSSSPITLPEPPSLVMAVIAMAACTAGFLISRRKPARAL
jgi:hypothetical protein